MSEKFFPKYCEAALATLKSQFEATKVLKHNPTIGSVREQLIKDFLTSHLPELVTVVSGQIADAKGNYSKQQDMVLVLKSMPRLPFASGNDLIFCEGVIATIEVKSTLDKPTLIEIGKNILSIRKLKPNISSTAIMGNIAGWNPNRVYTGIIAYEGNNLSSLKDTLEAKDFNEDSKPDFLLHLNQGILIRKVQYTAPVDPLFVYLLHEEYPNQISSYSMVDKPAEGFMQFLTFLTEITGILSSRGVHWREYW